MILEHRYGFTAMARSRELMRGNMWRAGGVLLIGWTIIRLLSFVFGAAFKLVPVVGPVADGLAQSIGVAYSSVVLVLLYFDIRCRKEAFDLDHLAQVLVPEPAAGLEVGPALVHVEVGAADVGGGDPDEHVGGPIDLRVGDVFHAHVARAPVD